MAASGSRTTIPVLVDGYMLNNITTDLFSIDNYPLGSIHYWITDGYNLAGSLKVQVSDYEDSVTDGYQPGNPSTIPALSAYITQWVDLSAVVNFPVANAYTAQTITGGAPAQGMINLNLAGWKWMRLVYTASTGYGTLNIRYKGKRFSPSNI